MQTVQAIQCTDIDLKEVTRERDRTVFIGETNGSSCKESRPKRFPAASARESDALRKGLYVVWGDPGKLRSLGGGT